jgi:hypothetical protein
VTKSGLKNIYEEETTTSKAVASIDLKPELKKRQSLNKPSE